MSKNISTSQRTKHLDLRYRYIADLTEDFLNIVYVPTDQNMSDWFTKNVNSEVYRTHVDEYMTTKEEIEIID